MDRRHPSHPPVPPDVDREPLRLPRGHLHGAPERHARAADLDVFLRRFPAASGNARHAHEPPLLCLTVEGGCEDRHAGGRSCHARGDLFFWPAGEPHAQRFPVASRFLIVELDGRAEARLDWHGLGPTLVVDGAARAGAWRALAELEHPDDLTPLALEGLLLDVGTRVLRTERPRRRGPRPAWIDEAHELLRSRLASAPSLAELGRAFDLHPASLARAFRRHEGVSVGERLRELRVAEASRLLVTTRLPLAEVALAAGFADQSHLTRVFRRMTGRTPGSLRR